MKSDRRRTGAARANVRKASSRIEGYRAARALLTVWPPTLLVIAVIVFYWKPLTSPGAYIQWDAVDVHYSSQRYFSNHVRQGSLPFWTPYLFSGFPFLADPQVGAWYPLNWPFFLLGITPKSIEYELILHTLVACMGAYFVAVRVLADRTAAIVTAFAYGFSGFFIGHSSHVGMFQTAAWFPWLLLCFHATTRGLSRRRLALGGLVGGTMILAGHFQATLYAFAALGLWTMGQLVQTPARWMRIVAAAAAIAGLAVLLSAVQTLPGLELAANSIRARGDLASRPEGVLPLHALLTLLRPNYLGALSGSYTGPEDRTQYYFYAGLLSLPLALLGLRLAYPRRLAMWLAIPTVWYALGSAAGLYSLIAWLPGFRHVRSPVHAWFVVGFAIALLAGAGAALLRRRFRTRSAVFGLAMVLFLDLFHWSSAPNGLAYSPIEFQTRYGVPQERGRPLIAATRLARTRFLAPNDLSAFGSMNYPLDLELEAASGYNPLELARYDAYRKLANSNHRLVDALNVSRYADVARQQIVANPHYLPRAYFARTVEKVSSVKEMLARLRVADPAQVTMVVDSIPVLGGDATASADIVSHEEQAYRVRYRVGTPGLLRMAVPYFPGWQATVSNVPCQIVPADYAFLGVVIPAGEGEVNLRFHSTYFAVGVTISVLTLAVIMLMACWPKHPRVSIRRE